MNYYYYYYYYYCAFKNTFITPYMYFYLFAYVCVCVCVFILSFLPPYLCSLPPSPSLPLSLSPYSSLLKASYSSDSINSEVSLLHESLRQAMESSDPNSLESYITIYGFLCDLHNIPYIPEISSVSISMIALRS